MKSVYSYIASCLTMIGGSLLTCGLFATYFKWDTLLTIIPSILGLSFMGYGLYLSVGISLNAIKKEMECKLTRGRNEK